MKKPVPVTENPWRRLREFTDARIGLGRAGVSLPTSELLAFQLAHAQARDAVHCPLDVPALCGALASNPTLAALGSPLHLQSQAVERQTYLQRPDLGRRLNDTSRQLLQGQAAQSPVDLAIVIVDGLSAVAVQQNAAPFLSAFTQLMSERLPTCRFAPISVVEQGRVAIGDDIGALLNARAVLLLVGERPGLSSPDSLGLYLTWAPRPGLTDAARNCISNIRPAGLSSDEAARRAVYLLQEAQRLQLSGVRLKDRTDERILEHDGGTRSFLVSD
jgi:ethanolamine ammonia-lyase small subunit